MAGLIEGILQSNSFRPDISGTYKRTITGPTGNSLVLTVKRDENNPNMGRFVVAWLGGELDGQIVKDDHDTIAECASDAIVYAHQLLKIVLG